MRRTIFVSTPAITKGATHSSKSPSCQGERRSGSSGPERSSAGLIEYGSFMARITAGSCRASSIMFSMIAMVTPEAPPLNPCTRSLTCGEVTPWRVCISRWTNHVPRSEGMQSNPQAWTIRAPLLRAASWCVSIMRCIQWTSPVRSQ